MNNTLIRYEKKFIITPSQKEELLNRLKDILHESEFSKERVYSIYFDNDSFDVIRYSISHPDFKEKLRIRSYKLNPTPNDDVYIELKRKIFGVGFKRRIKIKYKDLNLFIKKGSKPSYLDNYVDNEIFEEIKNHLKIYKSTPKIFISCGRESYIVDGYKDLRITIDSDVRYRFYNLDFIEGKDDLYFDNNECILELKFNNTIPYEISKLFSELNIYRTKFSKYGKIYTKKLKEKNNV